MRVFWILVKCPAVATARNAFSFFSSCPFKPALAPPATHVGPFPSPNPKPPGIAGWLYPGGASLGAAGVLAEGLPYQADRPGSLLGPCTC